MREIQIGDVVFVEYASWKEASLSDSEIARYSGIEFYTQPPENGRVALVTSVDDHIFSVQLRDGKSFSVPKQFCRLLEDAVWNFEPQVPQYYAPFSGMVTFDLAGNMVRAGYPNGGISYIQNTEAEKPKRKNDEIETPDDDEIIQRGIETKLTEEKRKNDEG